jgi:RNA polymerase sigma factor (sigma-70 family)
VPVTAADLLLLQSDVAVTADVAGVADVGRAEDAVRPVAETSAVESPSVMAHYLHDIRQYALLSHERELDLARQIQEGGKMWQETFTQSLLHVPYLLACRSHVRRGSMEVSAICDPTSAPSHAAFMEMLDALQRCRCYMRRLVMGGVADSSMPPQAVLALRDEMARLIQGVVWQPFFLQQAWSRFHTAMAATPARQRRQARRFASTLAYNMEDLRQKWFQLQSLHGCIESAKQELVTRNLRLVISVAREFQHIGLPLTDLVQEGNIGLMRAADKFDYRRNLKFSTYAVWWIKQAMRRAVYEQNTLIRVPEYMHESARQIHKALPGLTIELGRTPTAAEVAQRLELPVDRVERSLNLTGEPLSLDQLWTDDGKRTTTLWLTRPPRVAWKRSCSKICNTIPNRRSTA